MQNCQFIQNFNKNCPNYNFVCKNNPIITWFVVNYSKKYYNKYHKIIRKINKTGYTEKTNKNITIIRGKNNIIIIKISA